MAYKPKRHRCTVCWAWLFEYDSTGITRTRKGVKRREYYEATESLVQSAKRFGADAATVSAWPRTEAAPDSNRGPVNRIEVGCTCGKWWTFTIPV